MHPVHTTHPAEMNAPSMASNRVCRSRSDEAVRPAHLQVFDGQRGGPGSRAKVMEQPGVGVGVPRH